MKKLFFAVMVTVLVCVAIPASAVWGGDLWQIGKSNGSVNPIFGSGEYPASEAWTATFDYFVGVDSDPINSPSMPGYIGSMNVCDIDPNRACTDTTAELNIHFTLDCLYNAGELFFVYDRYGSESDTLYLDGVPFATINGAEGGFRQFKFDLGLVPPGDHTITIEYGGGGAGNGHYIDYVELVSNVSCVPLCTAQSNNAGSVSVSNDNENLTVTYYVDEPWCLTETHLDVATSLEAIPQKNGNPIPGHFDFGDDELGCRSSWSQVIPLADLAEPRNPLYIAAHAVVLDQSGEYATGEEICADFSKVSEGVSVEGYGTVAEHLNIDANGEIGTARKIIETGNSPYVAYGAPNSACYETPILNGGLAPAPYGGFSDLTAKTAGAPHFYAFEFDAPITDFSLRMLDFGDYNPSRDTTHLVEMKSSYLGVYGTSQTLTYKSDGKGNPTVSELGNLTCGTGDAVDAIPGEPGNYTWQVSGEGIDKVELIFGVGYDPNIGFDTLCFTTAGTETAWGNGPCAIIGTLPFDGKNWATYFMYTVQE